MAASILVFVALCVAASAAPPAQFIPLDYSLDNPEVANYYNQQISAQQKQASSPNGAPSRLETLEPDSEVELIPGAQQPQQPPQQTPVSPNLPGLAPGQRVFIVHMPVPGYRPGTIGGYQPVYIVATAPQGNPGFPGNGYQNGYQNAILLDPSGQTVLSPFLGYPRAGVGGVSHQVGNPGFLLGNSLVNRPFDFYQDPALAYQSGGPALQPDGRGPVRLAQLVSLQGQPPATANSRPNGNAEAASQPKRLTQASAESKEASEEPHRNARPGPPHTQTRTKA